MDFRGLDNCFKGINKINLSVDEYEFLIRFSAFIAEGYNECADINDLVDDKLLVLLNAKAKEFGVSWCSEVSVDWYVFAALSMVCFGSLI